MDPQQPSAPGAGVRVDLHAADAKGYQAAERRDDCSHSVDGIDES